MEFVSKLSIFIFQEKQRKSKTQVTNYKLRVQIYKLRVQTHELRVQIHELEH